MIRFLYVILWMTSLVAFAEPAKDLQPISDWELRWEPENKTVDQVRAKQDWAVTKKVSLSKKAKYLWLRTKLPDSISPRSSIYIPSVIEVFEAYVETEMFHHYGDINLKDDTRSFGHPWHIVKLSPDWAGKTVYFKIASPVQRIGISSATSNFRVSIGTSEAIVTKLLNQNFTTFLIGTVALFTGLFLFLAATVIRDWALGYLSMFVVALGTYVFTLSKLHFLLINTPVAWGYINVYSVFLAPIFFCSFAMSIFPSSTKLLRWFQALHIIMTIVFSVLIVMDLAHIRKCQSIFNMVLIFTLVAVFYSTVKQAKGGDVNSRLFAIGYLFLAGFSIMDVLVGFGLTALPIKTDWGIFLFLVCMMAIGFRKFLIQRERRIYLDKNLQDAQSVQVTLIPQTITIPSLPISSFYQSAKETGGDWFDLHYDEEKNRAYAFVADVTGHGISAALITGVVCGATKSLLHELMATMDDPDEILKTLALRINQSILSTGSRTGRMTTMSLFAIDLTTGALSCVNAAHPIIHVIRNRRVKPVVSQGSPLGFDAAPEFKVSHYQLEPNDLIFIHTDGLTENKGPDGKALHLRLLIRQLPKMGQDPRSMQDGILAAGNAIWQGQSPEDDCTFLILQWNPDPAKTIRSIS